VTHAPCRRCTYTQPGATFRAWTSSSASWSSWGTPLRAPFISSKCGAWSYIQGHELHHLHAQEVCSNGRRALASGLPGPKPRPRGMPSLAAGADACPAHAVARRWTRARRMYGAAEAPFANDHAYLAGRGRARAHGAECLLMVPAVAGVGSGKAKSASDYERWVLLASLRFVSNPECVKSEASLPCLTLCPFVPGSLPLEQDHMWGPQCITLQSRTVKKLHVFDKHPRMVIGCASARSPCPSQSCNAACSAPQGGGAPDGARPCHSHRLCRGRSAPGASRRALRVRRVRRPPVPADDGVGRAGDPEPGSGVPPPLLRAAARGG
jgi:hypothetical protein